MRWGHRLTVPQFTEVPGALVIASGTLLLAPPLCSSDEVGLWQALFTVTSAITVTDLSIIDVGKDLTFFGQVTLAGLIITGGLGLMASTTFLQGFVQGRSGLRLRLDKGRALDEFGVGGIGPTFHQILITADCVMGVGTVILYSFGFTDISNQGKRIWVAMFHCISAYNNAGFGLWSDNLVGHKSNPVVNGVIGSLIVTGGIGWRVTNDLWEKRFRLQRIRRLSLHTRLVLRSTLLLIVIGAFGLMIVLMFIGASPGGTGGGIKSTTFAVLMGATRSTLEGREEVIIRKHQIPGDIVLKALGVALASGLFVILMTLLLGLGPTAGGEPTAQAYSFLEKPFTCMSAFGTVGLDVGVTANLNRWGQLVLMVGMFVGRLGTMLLLSALCGSRPPSRVGYPREEVFI
jgi:Trk-type K+ transport system membrane component